MLVVQIIALRCHSKQPHHSNKLENVQRLRPAGFDIDLNMSCLAQTWLHGHCYNDNDSLYQQKHTWHWWNLKPWRAFFCAAVYSSTSTVTALKWLDIIAPCSFFLKCAPFFLLTDSYCTTVMYQWWTNSSTQICNQKQNLLTQRNSLLSNAIDALSVLIVYHEAAHNNTWEEMRDNI